MGYRADDLIRAVNVISGRSGQELNDRCRCGEVEEAVEHPKHYNQGNIEVIEVIEDWELDFCEGNAIKYIARARHKGSYKEDIQKAIWYLKRLLKED